MHRIKLLNCCWNLSSPFILVNISHYLFPFPSVQYSHSGLEFIFLFAALNFKFSVHASLWVYVSLARLQELLWKLHGVVSFSLSRSHRLLCAVQHLSTDTHPFLFPSACQCNGHSKCINESICEKCENLTTGKHCETCISGYYGDPTNGGTCQRKWCLNSSFVECFGVLLLFTHSSTILTEIISR